MNCELASKTKAPGHTGVTLEPRVILADYSKSEDLLTVYLSNQAPHMMQHIFAIHLHNKDQLRLCYAIEYLTITFR